MAVTTQPLPEKPLSLDFYGGGTALLAAVIGRCTALRAAMHTGRIGARFTPPESRPFQVGTALGVVVPLDTQWWCPQGNSLLLASS